MWNFHKFQFLALEFPSGVTQFCGVSKGQAFFGLEFPGVKWQTYKFQRLFKKLFPQPPPVFFFFSETVQCVTATDQIAS